MTPPQLITSATTTQTNKTTTATPPTQQLSSPAAAVVSSLVTSSNFSNSFNHSVATCSSATNTCKKTSVDQYEPSQKLMIVNNHGNTKIERKNMKKIIKNDHQTTCSTPPCSSAGTNTTNNQLMDSSGKFTFHTVAVMNNSQKEQKKRRKREALEGCNHFKLSNNSGESDQILEQFSYPANPKIVGEVKKKQKKNPKHQVSNFDVLSMTNNNSMFGVFKKKPSQHAYETVLTFNSDSNNYPTTGFESSIHVHNAISSPIGNHNLSSKSSRSPSPIPLLSNNNGSLETVSTFGLQQYPPNQAPTTRSSLSLSSSSIIGNTTPPTSTQQQSSTNFVFSTTGTVTTTATTLPPKGVESTTFPTRDDSKLLPNYYGTLTRSSHFQSATDMLFSELEAKRREKANVPSHSNYSRNQSTSAVKNAIVSLPSINDLTNNCHPEDYYSELNVQQQPMTAAMTSPSTDTLRSTVSGSSLSLQSFGLKQQDCSPPTTTKTFVSSSLFSTNTEASSNHQLNRNGNNRISTGIIIPSIKELLK